MDFPFPVKTGSRLWPRGSSWILASNPSHSTSTTSPNNWIRGPSCSNQSSMNLRLWFRSRISNQLGWSPSFSSSWSRRRKGSSSWSTSWNCNRRGWRIATKGRIWRRSTKRVRGRCRELSNSWSGSRSSTSRGYNCWPSRTKASGRNSHRSSRTTHWWRKSQRSRNHTSFSHSKSKTRSYKQPSKHSPRKYTIETVESKMLLPSVNNKN